MALTNQQRVAHECVCATGTSPEHARRLAATGLITKTQPVPDAATSAQRSFEAYATHSLAEALHDKQVDRIVFGIISAIPRPDGLDLEAHPPMLNNVLAALLPRYQPEYGGVIGVPGLRPRHENGVLVLSQLGTGALLRIVNKNIANLDIRAVRYPDREPRETQVWLKQPDHLHPREEDLLETWALPSLGNNPAARNYLYSRLLRRPRLVARTGTCRNSVNSYNHGFEDMVLEYCCGEDDEDLSNRLRRSGLDYIPEESGWEPPEEDTGATILLDESKIVLRQNCRPGLDHCSCPKKMRYEESHERFLRELREEAARK
ncbi:MAG: hypothetical protein ACRC20_12260 [Segniliparus sp.]|uniref:hypothetical protein n=1 Tax=Segniliparus sp. TaxID=2804064 RepID=UPI003F3C5E03